MKWTEELYDAVKTYFENGYSDWEIADALDLEDARQVRNARSKLGLKKSHGYKWTDAMIDELKSPEFANKTNKELAAHFGVHATTVHRKRLKLGLQTSTQHMWTAEEENFLRENWHKMRPIDIARKLNQSPNLVSGKATHMGLKR